MGSPAEQVQFRSQERAMPELASCTTVIIRKLGRNSSRDQLMQLLDAGGFTSQYDFVYVPRHFSRGSSFGFGVVNFVNHEFAMQALQKFVVGAIAANNTTLTAAWSDSMHG